MKRIEKVKQKAILEVAESLGYSFKRLSGQVYEHPEHDSFRIFADTNTFKWFSRDIRKGLIMSILAVVNPVKSRFENESCLMCREKCRDKSSC